MGGIYDILMTIDGKRGLNGHFGLWTQEILQAAAEISDVPAHNRAKDDHQYGEAD